MCSDGHMMVIKSSAAFTLIRAVNHRTPNYKISGSWEEGLSQRLDICITLQVDEIQQVAVVQLGLHEHQLDNRVVTADQVTMRRTKQKAWTREAYPPTRNKCSRCPKPEAGRSQIPELGRHPWGCFFICVFFFLKKMFSICCASNISLAGEMSMFTFWSGTYFWPLQSWVIT